MSAVAVAGLEGREEKLAIATVPPVPEDSLQIGLPADIQSLFDLPVTPVPPTPLAEPVDHPPNQTTDTTDTATLPMELLPTIAVEDSEESEQDEQTEQTEQTEESESEEKNPAPLPPPPPPPPPTRLDSLVPPTSEHDEFDVSWNELLEPPAPAPPAPAPTEISTPSARAPSPSQNAAEVELLAPTIESDSEDEESVEALLPLDSLPNLPPMRLTWQSADTDLASAFPTPSDPPQPLNDSSRSVSEIVTEFEALAPPLPPPPPAPVPEATVTRGPRRKGGGRPVDA